MLCDDPRPMTGAAYNARWVAAIAAATVTLHTVRFASHPAEAEAHGHMPLLIGAVAAAVLAVLWRFFSRLRAGGDARACAPRLGALWGTSTALVLGTFAGQEALEALLVPEGHGLAGLVGDGAWTVPVLAAGLGLGIALLVRGAQQALVRAARRAGRSHRGASLPARRPHEAPAPRLVPMARRLAGRGPPARRLLAA
jgi:hypothetical protein